MSNIQYCRMNFISRRKAGRAKKETIYRKNLKTVKKLMIEWSHGANIRKRKELEMWNFLTKQRRKFSIPKLLPHYGKDYEFVEPCIRRRIRFQLKRWGEEKKWKRKKCKECGKLSKLFWRDSVCARCIQKSNSKLMWIYEELQK